MHVNTRYNKNDDEEEGRNEEQKVRGNKFEEFSIVKRERERVRRCNAIDLASTSTADICCMLTKRDFSVCDKLNSNVSKMKMRNQIYGG